MPRRDFAFRPILRPQLPPTAHERLARFFGIRLRLVGGILSAGAVGGVFGAAYLWVLDTGSHWVGPSRWSGPQQVAVMASTGVIVALLVRWLGRPADVELLVDNIHVPDGDDNHGARLRSLIPISLACISVGGTLGPEAPVVTFTGTMSYRLAKRFQLDTNDVRTMTITGMAAGFAVLFGAPLGGALFALEIPHRRGIEYHEAVVPAAIGAVIGYACSTAAGHHGLSPVWGFPPLERLEWVDLAWSLVAGLVGAAIAAVFTALTAALLWATAAIPAPGRPAVGGVALGALAIWSPFALTNGEFQIDGLMMTATVGMLVIAAVAKLVAASVAVATGWRGGFIIPLFFVGFCVGRAMAPHLPGVTEWAFVLSVMIAANVGVTKTPLGSTLTVVEMAGATVLPSAVIASLVSLVVAAPLGMIDAQRSRLDIYGTAT